MMERDVIKPQYCMFHLSIIPVMAKARQSGLCGKDWHSTGASSRQKLKALGAAETHKISEVMDFEVQKFQEVSSGLVQQASPSSIPLTSRYMPSLLHRIPWTPYKC